MASTQGTPSILVVTTIDGTVIEQVEKIPVPEGKIGKIPLTNQDSGYGDENMPGRFTPGDTVIQGIYTTGKTGINYLKSICGDYKIHEIKVTLIDGTIVSVNAYLGPFILKDDNSRVLYTVELMTLGIPDISTDTAELTTFTVGTGGTKVPAAAITPGEYSVNVTNSTSTVPITCADTASGSGIYVDGTKVTTFPHDITTAVGLTKVVIKVSEPDKADGFYNLTFARAS